jgi:hypothetical protein
MASAPPSAVAATPVPPEARNPRSAAVKHDPPREVLTEILTDDDNTAARQHRDIGHNLVELQPASLGQPEDAVSSPRSNAMAANVRLTIARAATVMLQHMAAVTRHVARRTLSTTALRAFAPTGRQPLRALPTDCRTANRVARKTRPWTPRQAIMRTLASANAAVTHTSPCNHARNNHPQRHPCVDRPHAARSSAFRLVASAPAVELTRLVWTNRRRQRTPHRPRLAPAFVARQLRRWRYRIPCI